MSNAAEQLDPRIVGYSQSYVPLPLDSIPLERKLQFDIYVKLNDKFVLFRPKSDTISKKRAERLKQSKVRAVYISKLDWPRFLGSFYKELPSDTEILRGGSQKSIEIRNYMMAYGQWMENTRTFRRREYKTLEKLSNSLALGIYHNTNLGTKLLRRYSDSSFYTVNHTINVAILSAKIGKRLMMSGRQLQILTLAGLTHNMGILQIPKSILYKPDKLTPAEWEVMQTHAEHGAQQLMRLNAPTEIVEAARQHHENYDGSGYPAGLKGKQIHIFAQIIAVADVYDAITSNRPYNRGVKPPHAIEELRRMQGKFNPELLSITE